MMSTRTSKTTNNKPSACILFFLLQGFIAGILLVVDAVPCFPDKETLKTAIFGATVLRSVGDQSGVGYVHETYGAIESWCFDSNLTDFSGLFRYSSKFNADISRWDVSSVTNMRSMFYYAQSFNQDISRWKVSLVTDMEGMFDEASTFNGDISGWDVSSVTNMAYMFHKGTKFNQDIGVWDVSSVTDMKFMVSDPNPGFNMNVPLDWGCFLT